MLLPVALMLSLPAFCADSVEIPVLADTGVCCHSSERDLNCGGSSRFKMKGLEDVVLLGIDPAPVLGKVVENAFLLVRGTASNMMVRKIGLSTIAGKWAEGRGNWERGPGATFLSPGEGRWAGPDSVFWDAIWGRSGTIWSQTFTARGEDGWYRIPVDGRLIEACAAGLSYGLAISDDSGQTMNISREICPGMNFSNNFFFSREAGSDAPRIVAETAPAPIARRRRLGVTVKPWASGADFESGGVEVAWAGDPAAPAETIGYRIRLAAGEDALKELPRWMHPAPGPAGERVRALLKGFPPRASIRVEVEVVGRGGVVVAGGSGTGRVSPALKAVRAVPVTVEIPAAGEPPAAGAAEVWAIPDCAKANPVTGNVLEEPGVEYAGVPAGEWRRANAVWSGRDGTVRLSALRGEWVAFQLVCASREVTEFSITPGDLTGPRGKVIPGSAIRLSRLWYQKVGEGDRRWYADPMLPLAAGDGFNVPDPANAVPGQRNQAVYAELFVPVDAEPGSYSGAVAVRTAGGAIPVRIELAVGRAAIPREAHFTWSFNAYSSPGHGYGEPPSDGFLAAERAFYAMAHEHRGCLAVLHYGHSGGYSPAAAPPVAGRGEGARVRDWSEWDRRFGPLLDGTALAGTRREGVPLDHFYLVLSEHYPVSMAEGYRWNDLKWEDHWLKAGPIEEGFGREYQETWVAVAKDHLKHIRERGWKTKFHVYLNDKYFYKQYDEKRKAHGPGVSFWLLDEPHHIDDFHALKFFGELLRRAQGGDRDSLVYRVDLSRPEASRETLSRVMDLNVSGGLAEYARFLADWRERHGQVFWTYGTTPGSDESALSLSALALDLYSRGADGYVPWLVLGSEENWTAFEKTCVIYTGRPRGISGPCASLRLKAYRRAEQDVEYAWLLAGKRGLLRGDPGRERLRAMLAEILRGERKAERFDGHGAIVETMGGVDPSRLEAFRRALQQELD